jgi:Flp pilus assembly protein TadD
MLLACPPSDAGFINGFKSSPESLHYLQEAIVYHGKHLEFGPDNGGRFVANSNLGLCLGMLGEVAGSAKHHQDSLRIAIKMQTLYGQAIAVGNLGMLALLRSDLATSRTCFEQHLQLVQALLDPAAEINAWKLLARLNTLEGRHAETLESLDQARRVATREGHMNELRRINCLVGLAKAGLEFDSFSESLVVEAREFE